MKTGSAHSFVHVKCLLPSRRGKDKLSGRSMATAYMQRKQEMKTSFPTATRLHIKALMNMNLNELQCLQLFTGVNYYWWQKPPLNFLFFVSVQNDNNNITLVQPTSPSGSVVVHGDLCFAQLLIVFRVFSNQYHGKLCVSWSVFVANQCRCEGD